MFSEREIHTTPTMVAAAALWTASMLIWVANCFVDSRSLATLAIIVCGGAATVTVRHYFVRWSAEVKNALIVLHGAAGEKPVKPVR